MLRRNMKISSNVCILKITREFKKKLPRYHLMVSYGFEVIDLREENTVILIRQRGTRKSIKLTINSKQSVSLIGFFVDDKNKLKKKSGFLDRVLFSELMLLVFRFLFFYGVLVGEKTLIFCSGLKRLMSKIKNIGKISFLNNLRTMKVDGDLIMMEKDFEKFCDQMLGVCRGYVIDLLEVESEDSFVGGFLKDGILFLNPRLS